MASREHILPGGMTYIYAPVTQHLSQSGALLAWGRAKPDMDIDN